MNEHKDGLAAVICPTCGHANNGAMNLPGMGNGAPEPGDIGICASCVGLFEYTGEPPTCAAALTADVRAQLSNDPRVIAAQVALRYAAKVRHGR